RKQVERLLKEFHTISERRYAKADYSSCDIIVDLESAIGKASLTETQKDIIELYYVKDVEQEDIAELLDVNQSTVSRGISTALDAISYYYCRDGTLLDEY